MGANGNQLKENDIAVFAVEWNRENMRETSVEMLAKGVQFDPELPLDANYFQNMLIGIFGYQCSKRDSYKLRGARGSATSAYSPDD